MQLALKKMPSPYFRKANYAKLPRYIKVPYVIKALGGFSIGDNDRLMPAVVIHVSKMGMAWVERVAD